MNLVLVMHHQIKLIYPIISKHQQISKEYGHMFITLIQEMNKKLQDLLSLVINHSIHSLYQQSIQIQNKLN